MSELNSLSYDLTIIGAGMTGMAASIFAANRGVRTVLVGRTGESLFMSGLLDLLGVHPVNEKRCWDDPWAGIEAVVRDLSDHPYARLKREDIRAAFDEFLAFFRDAGLPYQRRMEKNTGVLTAVGTIKKTYCVPMTMWKGAQALEEKAPCLIVDFKGLRGFSARQIVSTLGAAWPNLRAATVDFPGSRRTSEIFPEQIANGLELSGIRSDLAAEVGQHLGDARVVGMPAVLGTSRFAEVIEDLEKQTGAAVFEIPTMPPSIIGMRMRELFERRASQTGIRVLSFERVLEAKGKQEGGFELGIGNTARERTIHSTGVILATGRFIGKGLYGERTGIRETVFDLPVFQPETRAEWHRDDFFDLRGHPVNCAGLETDESFRPLDRSGKPAYANLFAAGSILAHQDWMRMKCGSGLAIATAYAVINAFVKSGKRS